MLVKMWVNAVLLKDGMINFSLHISKGELWVIRTNNICRGAAAQVFLVPSST